MKYVIEQWNDQRGGWMAVLGFYDTKADARSESRRLTAYGLKTRIVERLF